MFPIHVQTYISADHFSKTTFSDTRDPKLYKSGEYSVSKTLMKYNSFITYQQPGNGRKIGENVNLK